MNKDAKEAHSKEIQNGEGHLDASHSVIVFPSLTTPTLLRRGFPLDIIVVGDDVLKNRFEKEAALTKGAEAGPEFMRFCHSHLSLVPWRGQKGKKKKKQKEEQLPDAQGEAAQKDDSSAEPPRAVSGHVWLSNMKELASFKNMLYNKEKHLGPVKLFGTSCKGWFIAELPEAEKPLKKDMMVGWEGNEKKPCGILAKEALNMYAASKDKPLRWLFHLRFGDIENTSMGMCELVWTCARYHRESNDHKNICHYLPVEELILPKFTEQFVRGGDKAHGQVLLSRSLPDLKEDDPLFDYGDKQRREHIYNMRSLGQSFSVSDKEKYMYQKTPATWEERLKRERELQPYVAAVEQDGWQFGPRHPVFISAKERLNLGIVADPHISSRQSLYKMVGARVIPGVDQVAGSFEPIPACDYRRVKNKYSNKYEIIGSSFATIEPPEATDSPLIGPMCHENLQSTRELMSRLGKQSDIITFIGDMYDHIRNCDTKWYITGSSGSGKTTKLWKFMDFYEEYQDNFFNYPRFLDASMGLNLIYQSYAEGKPVCFVTGNHEAYEKAYGISPRIKIGNLWTLMKTNDGIPLDHNLTFYEAILLYGPGYPDMQKGRVSWDAKDLWPIDIGLFEQENFLWTRLFLSPWKDINLTYGNEQDILMLDWREGEQYVRNALQDTLPIAKEAISADQLTLFEYFASKNGSETVSTQLITHFTHVGYTHSLPLLRDKFAKPQSRGDDITQYKRDGEYWVPLLLPVRMSESMCNTGRFLQRTDEVWKKFAALPNAFTISGHTHRAGLYEEYGSGLETVGTLNAPGIEKMESIPLAGRKSPPILVSGSCGTYNKHNMMGEFAGRGMDKPQGMVLCLDKGSEKVDIIRSNVSLKPRLAVVLDYLWSDGKPLFVPQKDWGKIESYSPLHILGKRIMSSHKHENHIVSGHPDNFYGIELNMDVARYFCSQSGGAIQNPVKTIKLHAVKKDGSHVGCLVMHAEPAGRNEIRDDGKENTVDSAQAMRISLRALGKEVTYFLTTYLPDNDCEPDDRLLYLSIHFAEDCALFYGDHYDLSPWCFPVRATMSRYGTYTLERGWRNNDNEGSEYPDFKLLNDIEEYKIEEQ